MLNGIHHVAIIVSDLQKAKTFYVDKLGFQIVREVHRPEKKDCKLDLDIGNGVCLEIFAVQNPPERLSYPEAAGLRHLAFCVENVEDAVNRLAEKEISCESVRVDPFDGKRFTFFSDPDGLPIELHE